MAYKILFGEETESIEDPNQMVLVTLPDDAADLDEYDLIERIYKEGVKQALVGVQDMIEVLRLTLDAVSVDKGTAERIEWAMKDILDLHEEQG